MPAKVSSVLDGGKMDDVYSFIKLISNKHILLFY